LKLALEAMDSVSGLPSLSKRVHWCRASMEERRVEMREIGTQKLALGDGEAGPR